MLKSGIKDLTLGFDACLSIEIGIETCLSSSKRTVVGRYLSNSEHWHGPWCHSFYLGIRWSNTL